MDMMKAMQDPAMLQALTQTPATLNSIASVMQDILVVLQEIRDAVILQNSISALGFKIDLTKDLTVEYTAASGSQLTGGTQP